MEEPPSLQARVLPGYARQLAGNDERGTQPLPFSGSFVLPFSRFKSSPSLPESGPVAATTANVKPRLDGAFATLCYYFLYVFLPFSECISVLCYYFLYVFLPFSECFSVSVFVTVLKPRLADE